jgi:hypothetical protein
METDCDHLNGGLRRAALAAIALTLLFAALLAAVPCASAIVPLSITAPQAVDEGQPVVVSLAGAGNLTILRNGEIVASGTSRISDTLQTNSSSSGLITYLFTDGVQNATRDIEVRDVPLALNITGPTTDVAASDVSFALTTNWAPEFCYVNIDGVGHTLAPAGPTAFNGTFHVDDGVHTADYKCKLGTELAAVSRTLHIDAQPPKVTAASPSGDVIGPYVTLTVDTDEIAECRYSTQDIEFSAMQDQMGTTYAVRNTAALQLAQQGSYTYFVRCQDVYGNTMRSSSIISFLNKIPPVASIDVNGKTPLKAGTYAVSLTTNVPLSAAPKLSYAFQESGRQQQIALSGANDRWTGYLIIPEEISDTVLSLSFEGTSREGVTGNRIASDSVFTIDAKAPKAVDAVTVDNSSSYITLKWFTTQASDVASYNIYRADHEGVAYTDLYSSTSLTEFTDRGAQGARYYYYRIAPVDFAGNIGPLSAEVYGSAVDEALKDVPMSAADPLLQARLDEEIASMTAAMLDANASLSALEQETNPTSVQIIKDMSLISKGREAMTKLETGRIILQELRSRSPTQAQVDDGIARSRELLGAARHGLIRRIVAQQQSETRQASDAAGLERDLPYVLAGQNLSAQERASYLGSAVQLQDKVTVTTIASSFTLYDIAGEAHPYTFVRKRVMLQDPQNDVTLIEDIPKSFAKDAGDIAFSAQPVVLQRDPIVTYSFPVLEQHEYTYSIGRIVSLDEVKSARTFLYPKLPAADVTPALAQDGGGSLTGQVTRLAIPFMPSTDSLLIIIGVLVIIALGAYYMSLSSTPFKGLGGAGTSALPHRRPEQPASPGRAASSGRVVSRPMPAQRPTQRMAPPSIAASPMPAVARAVPPVVVPIPTTPAPAVLAPAASPVRVTSASAIFAPSTSASAAAPASSAAPAPTASPALASPAVAAASAASATGTGGVAAAAAATRVMTSDAVEALLQEAERSIDSKEYEAALSLYKEVASHVRTDEDLGRILNARMARVYTKFLLYRRMADAHSALQQQDSPALKHALLDVREIAGRIGEEETTLIREAKSSYAALVKSLNALEIARAGRY